MTVYATGGDGHPTRYQPRCYHATWVLPGSPSVDAAAAAVSAVPIAKTTEGVAITKMKQSIHRYNSKQISSACSFCEESVEQKW